MKKRTLLVLILLFISLFLLSTISFAAEKFNIDKKLDFKLPELKNTEDKEVIFFSSFRNNNSDIFAYILNGNSEPILTHIASKVVQITDDEYNDSSPCLSPDGSQIAYASYREGYSRIFIMNVDGSNQERLTDSTIYSESYPVWSPDGEKLAFLGPGGLNIINKDGTNQHELSEEYFIAKELSWSPDGQKIAFMSFHEGTKEIYTINAEDGSEIIKLTEEGGVEPAWSPDGSKIAYSSYVEGGGYEIFVMDSDGSNNIRLTTNTSNKSDLDPCWTDDNRIIFSSYRTGNSDLYIMDADGSNQTRLTRHSGLDRAPDWGKIDISELN
ncbi:MAG: hypothetical protein ACQERL_09445 [Bacillota bacterium]